MKSDLGEKVFDKTVAFLNLLAKCLYLGIRGTEYNFQFWQFLIAGTGCVFYVTYDHDFLVLLAYLFPRHVSDALLLSLSKVDWTVYFALFSVSGLALAIILTGIKELAILSKYQKDFNFINLKMANGKPPRVVKVVKINEYKTRLIVKSQGIGVDKYESRKSDLTSALGQIVEDIRLCSNPKLTSFTLTNKEIPRKLGFYDVPKPKKEMSFCVGESLSGLEYQSLSDLPHMLIAGTTGGGKSCFFKQTLLSLLKSTEKIQVYLLDLKKGVEMRPFGELPNVRVAKTENEAVQILKKLKREMEKRFETIESKKVKEIDSKRHKLDKIVVGIDEASILYTKPKSNSPAKEVVLEARELTDELVKLSRAAGIHVILATQKVTKETIDTKVQENIGGRMCFRMNTFQGSLTVLGNKKAHQLPNVKGRGIWSCGNKFAEVQAPFLSESELEEELAALASACKANKKTHFGPMLETGLENMAKKFKTMPKGGENDQA